MVRFPAAVELHGCKLLTVWIACGEVRQAINEVQAGLAWRLRLPPLAGLVPEWSRRPGRQANGRVIHLITPRYPQVIHSWG